MYDPPPECKGDLWCRRSLPGDKTLSFNSGICRGDVSGVGVESSRDGRGMRVRGVCSGPAARARITLGATGSAGRRNRHRCIVLSVLRAHETGAFSVRSNDIHEAIAQTGNALYALVDDAVYSLPSDCKSILLAIRIMITSAP